MSLISKKQRNKQKKNKTKKANETKEKDLPSENRLNK